MQLLKIGYIRAQEDYKPFKDRDYAMGALPYMQSCSCVPFQLSTVFLICPLTSIIFGLGRLRNLFSCTHNEDTLEEKCYFFITGVVAVLGLGIIIASMRVILYMIRVLSRWICTVLINMHQVIADAVYPYDFDKRITLFQILYKCFSYVEISLSSPELIKINI